MMDEDTFNLQVRKFLKKVGITSQRTIEQAVREGIAAGRLQGDEVLDVTVTLNAPALEVRLKIDDTIALE